MKAVILAGGFGTRISEETHVIPKPMILIGGKPILWHIMKLYSHYGINDFVICLGYKGYVIKEYFANYYLHTSDVTFDMKSNEMHVHQNHAEPWRVTLVDTGENTMTGGRLKRVERYLEGETFCFTYGDGVADVDIGQLIQFHRAQNTMATLTAVQPAGRFGALKLGEEHLIESFQEKADGDQAWVNGGFFVLEPTVFQFIENDLTSWENFPVQKLSGMGQLSAYRHEGFWQPMDTLRDKNRLEELWSSNTAPWKKW